MVRFSTLILGAAAAVATTFGTASAAQLEARTVYNPEITFPTKGITWHAGHKVNVTWNTSSLPQKEIKEMQGTVILGHQKKNEVSEHLSKTLAKNFPLSSGNISFTLPANLTTRHDYIIVLMGDSGNASPPFTIKGKNH